MGRLLDRLRRLVRELRRRHVVRVGVAYLAVAWLVVEAATATFPYLGLPDWAVTLVIVLAAAGFPLALLLAWAFDLTPEGVRRTEEPHGAAGDVSAETSDGAALPVGPAPPAGLTLARPGALLGAVALLAAGLGAYLLLGPLSAGGEDGARGGGFRSIAVLPFSDLSPGGDHGYLGDGLGEEIIGALGRIEGLEVSARSSSFRFRDTEAGPRTVADSLDVGLLLEGSVQPSGDSVRIRARLVDAESERAIWTQSFDRALDDVLAVQQTIALEVVDTLKVRFAAAERERLATRPTESGEAYLLYLRGRHAWNSRTPAGMGRSLELFREALDRDPGYADAWAGLADAHVTLAVYGLAPVEEAYPRAREAALRALELDPGSARAHASLAATLSDHFFDWEGAEREYRRALELDPDYVIALYWYGEFLAHLGRSGEALELARRARRLDPLSVQASATEGLALYLARDYGAAVVRCDETLDRAPNVTAYLYGGLARSKAGDHEGAVAILEEAADRYGAIPTASALLGYAAGRAGQRERARRILEALLERRERGGLVYAVDVAAVHLGLGDREAAIDWLETGYEERNWQMRFLSTEPIFDPLRDDPRFRRLEERLGLPG